MAYTNPRTWATGDTISASALNTDLRDNMDYLKGLSEGAVFSGVALTRVAATSIADSTDTDITWASETEDIGGWWSSGVSVTVPSGAIPTGFTNIKLLVVARTLWDNNATGVRKLILLKNGTQFAAVVTAGITGVDLAQQITDFVTVASGDTVKLQVYQSSGGALECSETKITVVRFAPVS